MSANSLSFQNQSRQSSIHKITNISIGNCVSDVSMQNSLASVKTIYERVDGNHGGKYQNDFNNNIINTNNVNKNVKTDQNLLNVNKKIVFIRID